MASPSGNLYPVGLQHVRIYELSEFGYPKPASTAVYEGVEIVGPKTYDITAAKSRDIVHQGNNRRLSQDKLPSIDVSAATLKTSRLDFEVNALLANIKTATVGEALFSAFATDRQGTEPTVAMLLYQQAKTAEAGVRCYSAYHLPSVAAIIDPASMNENASEFSFNLVPSAASHYIHGPAFTLASEGFTEAEMLWSVTFGLPHIVAWLGNGTAVEFNFHADRPAPSTAKIHSVCTVTGAGVVTDVTSTITKAVDGITFSSAPDSGVSVICFYEY